MIRLIMCNLFHRRFWLGIRDFERMGCKPTKAIHCLICDGPMANQDAAPDAGNGGSDNQ